MYASKADDVKRRSAQGNVYFWTLLFHAGSVLAFTSEEIWKYLPHRKNDNSESIQLNSWPEANGAYEDPALKEKWDHLIEIREAALKALENARNEKVIGSSLEAEIYIKASGKEYEFLIQNKDILSMVCITSGVEVISDPAAKTIQVEVQPASGKKCERCWIYSKTVGENHNHPTICSRCADVVD